MTLLWLLSLTLRDASIVDIFWGLGFVSVYWIDFIIVHSSNYASQPVPAHHLLVGFLVTIWGLRLSVHILLLNWGHGKDFRYARWRGAAGQAWWWPSYFKVFLLQGFILWLVSFPV